MLIPKLSAVFIYTCNGKYSRKDIKRFLKYIRINKEIKCWEWTGSLNKKGYGNFSFYKNGKQINVNAHRAAIEMAMGILIPGEILCCHHCDNSKCVNVIECLFLGTHQDNMRDMMNKGRGNKVSGENHGRAKLTWAQVREIRKLWLTGKYTQRQLAIIFNINIKTINNIINNKYWNDNICR